MARSKNATVFDESLRKYVTRIKFINWYGFRNEIMPMCPGSTLLNGENGSGKTTAADGIKYGLFADTSFNASAGQGQSREIYTITRALRTYGGDDYSRPPHGDTKNVYSHIAVEFFDVDRNSYFVLETMIVTDDNNKTSTTRYVFDNKRIEDVVFYEESGGRKALFGAKEFAKRNGVIPMNREQGVEKFSNMMGLRLDAKGVGTLMNRFKALMAYNPKSDVSTLVKYSILEPVAGSDVIKRLKEAKEEYDRQSQILADIQDENAKLDLIIESYRDYVRRENRVISATIKNRYKELLDSEARYKSACDEYEMLCKRSDALEREEREGNDKINIASDRLSDAKSKLRGEESAFKVEEQQRDVERCEAVLEDAAERLKKLESFAPSLAAGLDIISALSDEEKRVLSDVCEDHITGEQKWALLKSVQDKAEAHSDTYSIEIAERGVERREILEEMSSLRKELEEINKHNHIPERAAEHVELRDKINEALATKGMEKSAKMAFEYVESIEDEEWRPVLENILGDARFNIIVPEEALDIAFAVQRDNKIYRPKLIRPRHYLERDEVSDSTMLSSLLVVPNEIARKYFDSLLSYKMVEKDQVKDYPYAIAKDGFYSEPRWFGYVNLRRTKGRYCLGYEARKLTAVAINAEIDALIERERVVNSLLDEAKRLFAPVSELIFSLNALVGGSVDLSAKHNYKAAERKLAEETTRLEEMREALSKNPKIKELQRMVDDAKDVLDAANRALYLVVQKKQKNETDMEYCIKRRDEEEVKLSGDEYAEAEEEQIGLRELIERYRATQPEATETAIQEYDEFLLTGDKEKAAVSERTIHEVYEKAEREAHEKLTQAQRTYCDSVHDFGIGHENMEHYLNRKERIEVRDMEEAISAQRKRKNRCFDMFNTEFLVAIRTSVEDAKREVDRLNKALENVGFAARYKIEIKEKRDGTMYEDILVQSRKQYLRGKAKVSGQQVDQLDDILEEEFFTEEQMESLMTKILSTEKFEDFEDYRNYLEYDVIVEGNGYAEGTRLSRQGRANSGAEKQIPYTVILTCGLLNIYNKRSGSARLLFMDEPFEKFDANNISIALDFFKQHNLQVLFVAGNKTGEIGEKCDLIVPVVNGEDENKEPDKTDARFGEVRRIA